MSLRINLVFESSEIKFKKIYYKHNLCKCNNNKKKILPGNPNDLLLVYKDSSLFLKLEVHHKF